MINEISEIVSILESFLGDSKNGVSADYEMEFGCPRCEEKYGPHENDKFNLAVNIKKGVFKCWKCESEGDLMKGSIGKLIKMYGNHEILERYRKAIQGLRESELYKLKFDDGDFADTLSCADDNSVKLPSNFVRLTLDNSKKFKKALDYLSARGIGWKIINEYGIGVTTYDSSNKIASNRIIIPSYDEYGSINYWTGRDFSGLSYRQKYFNPKAERKNIIFNEYKVQWDADITLVEGPFDHIVTPNSIPLLGKVIKPEFKLFQMLNDKARANVNIFLDADAYDTAKYTYEILNHGNLYGKIRFIPCNGDLDPSKIFELYGYKGIARHLRRAKRLSEVDLI